MERVSRQCSARAKNNLEFKVRDNKEYKVKAIIDNATHGQ